VTMGTWPPIEMELLKQIIDFGIYDKKTINHKGYHCAYEIFDPIDFFAELKKRGIQVYERRHEYRKFD